MLLLMVALDNASLAGFKAYQPAVFRCQAWKLRGATACIEYAGRHHGGDCRTALTRKAAAAQVWIMVVVAVLSATMSESAIDSLQNAIVDNISGTFLKFLPLIWTRILVCVLNIPVMVVSLQVTSCLHPATTCPITSPQPPHHQVQLQVTCSCIPSMLSYYASCSCCTMIRPHLRFGPMIRGRVHGRAGLLH